MGRKLYGTASFLISLSLVGIAIYYFIEGNSFNGKMFVFLALYAFISLFYMFRSIYYVRHSATFNEVAYVVFLPLIPLILILAQSIFEINEAMVFITGQLQGENIDLTYSINVVDILITPYYIFSNYLLFRSYIRYPFIRLTGTSEGGLPPKFTAFMLTIMIPLAYFLTSFLYLNNLFLIIFGGLYLYSGIIALFV